MQSIGRLSHANNASGGQVRPLATLIAKQQFTHMTRSALTQQSLTSQPEYTRAQRMIKNYVMTATDGKKEFFVRI